MPSNPPVPILCAAAAIAVLGAMPEADFLVIATSPQAARLVRDLWGFGPAYRPIAATWPSPDALDLWLLHPASIYHADPSLN